MSVGRAALLVGLLVGPVAAAAGPARSGGRDATRRVAFVNLAPAGADVAGPIGAARRDAGAAGLRALPPGPLRTALEAPLQSSPREPSPLGPARELLGAAREAYARFDYERALGSLEAADELLLDREPSEPVIELLVERHLLAGLVHEGRGHAARAVQSFRTVQHLAPDRQELDPGEFRPQVVTLYREARASEGEAAPLAIAVEPAGSRVWLDGRAAGAAPLSPPDVRPGLHWVVASAPGHEPRGELVEVAVGQPAAVRLVLAERPAAERVEELRRALAASAGRDELAAVAAQLAAAAQVELLVLVRARRGGAEGAVYDAASRELWPFAPLPSSRFTAQLAPPRGEDPGGAALVTASAPAADTAWYRTGWGKGLLVTGGLVASALILYAVTADDDPGYGLGDWCFAGEECR